MPEAKSRSGYVFAGGVKDLEQIQISPESTKACRFYVPPIHALKIMRLFGPLSRSRLLGGLHDRLRPGGIAF